MRRPDKVVVHDPTGRLFEPSFPDGYTTARATVEALGGMTHYYLREIRRAQRRWWWPFGERFKRTGAIEVRDDLGLDWSVVSRRGRLP